MNDLISRRAAIDGVINLWADKPFGNPDLMVIKDLIDALPSAEPGLDEWCTDCKEYDQERHCCPRWNSVIRNTLKDAERKKGKWIVDERRFGNMERHCSLCGAILEGVDWKWRNNYYCYHCGAEMEADDETN